MNERFLMRPRFAASLSLFLVLVGSLGLGGCKDSVAPIFTRWEADLNTVGASTLTGQAAAVTQFGRTVASILIEGGEEGSTYGWRINSGTCLDQGTIQGGSAQYPGLSPGEDGTGSAEAVLATVFRATGSFAARVFLAEGQGPEEVVACGNLVLIE